MLNGKMETAQGLLEGIECLPLDGLKHLKLRRGVRSLHQGDACAAQAHLRDELASWPENDAACNVLPVLVMQEKGKRMPFER